MASHVLAHEDSLLERILHYARRHDYTGDTPTLAAES